MALTADEELEYLALLEAEAKSEDERRAAEHAERERRRVETEAAEIRAKCGRLRGFIEEFWYVLEPVAELKFGWALEAMCLHLEHVTAGDIKRLLMTVPPGMMKSLLLVFWTAWEWGPKGLAHLSVLATSYSQPNVFRDNLKLRDLVTSEKYQALWPEVRLRSSSKGVRKFSNTRSGFSEARPFSKMTGGRADRVKIDDPHDTENAESDVQRTKTVKIMREAISDRVTNEAAAVVLIMQRLHEADCAAVAKELGYTHLNLPMEFEQERVGANGKVTGGKCRTVLRPANDGDPAIIFEDPRTEEGELLFPERFTPTWVAQLKRDKGSYAWAGQYQQRPAPRGGGMFKRDWFRIVDALPADPPRMRCRAWDFAGSENVTADATASVKGERHDDRYFFTHVTNDRLSPGAAHDLFVNTTKVDGYEVTVRLTQDPGSAGKSDVLNKIKAIAGYPAKKDTATGSKETRAQALAIQAEAGNVYLLRGEWNEAFLDQLCMFPAGAHDDMVDAAADCFNELALAPEPATALFGTYGYGGAA